MARQAMLSHEAGPLEWLASGWAAWKERRRLAREDARRAEELAYEIECLDRVGELDGTLATLGFGRGAVPMLIAKYPAALRRHDAMTAHLRVAPPGEARPFGLDALKGTRRRCLLCTESRRCETWLRRGGTGGADFCPNRSAFQRMRAVH